MQRRILSSSLLLAVFLVVAAPVFADHHEVQSSPPDMTPEAMQEYMAKYAAPGPEHKFFDYFMGDWTNASAMYMGPEPMKSTGTASWKWSLDGRYVQSTYLGEVMGQPFAGMGIDGYDRVAGGYFNIWFDNTGTGYMLSHGQVSADGKVLTTNGTYMDPMVGAEVPHRMVTTIKDKDHFSFVMYQTFPGAEETKSVEIEYTRANKAAAKK